MNIEFEICENLTWGGPSMVYKIFLREPTPPESSASTDRTYFPTFPPCCLALAVSSMVSQKRDKRDRPG